MAQPSSVQREPSMEEILASIRRIIEDNETSRKDDKVVPQPGSYRSSKDVPEDSHDNEPQPQATEARAAREDLFISEALQANPIMEEPMLAQMPVVEFNDAVAELSEPAFQAPEASLIPEPSISEQIAPEASTPILNIVEQHVADLIAAGDDEELTAPIVSEQSGRKVAASFGELSDAYQANRRKSLADAAEEMLRPMLREWLDDNLPQLVEKLVREEIERIARGN